MATARSRMTAACGNGLAVRGIAGWLCLAASPTFAAMALLAGLFGGGEGMLCGSMPASALAGMPPMYLLMSLFHLPPWLRLASRWCAHTPRP